MKKYPTFSHTVLLAGVLTLSSGSVFAEGSLISTKGSGFYGFLTYQNSEASSDEITPSSPLVPITTDNDHFSLGLGYSLNKYLAIESSYMDMDTLVARHGLAHDEMDISGWNLGAALSIPTTDKLIPFIKGGIYLWDREMKGGLYSYSHLAAIKMDGSDPYLGIGLEYGLNKRFSVIGDYTRYKADDIDVDTYSGGIKVDF